MYIEVIFAFPELSSPENGLQQTIPGFSQVIYSDANKNFKARMRLEAKWSSEEYDDEVESKLYWIITDSDIGFGDNFENKFTVSNQERRVIQIRYIPAFRNSNAILKNNIQNLVKLIIDYIDFGEESSISNGNSKIEEIEKLNSKLCEEIKEIRALKEIKNMIDKNWANANDNTLRHCRETLFKATPSAIKDLLKTLHLKLSPTECGNSCDIDMLSDGQVSLLYFTLAITLSEIEQRHYKNELNGLKPYDKIKTIFTIFAVEEPENHLSPFYLGRILNLINIHVENNLGASAIVSSHSASVIRRAEKLEQIRYFRQDASSECRLTKVNSLILPADRSEEDYKYINQAVLAHPEIYFAKLVILGEGGDSEGIIIPKLASKLGVDLDPSFISFVKLGGRHVNHMWRLLENLQIPYLTLLDFDLGRHGGGIKRFKYVIDELSKFQKDFDYPNEITYEMLSTETLNKD